MSDPDPTECPATAITSNIDLSDWGRYLGDATLTAAILDRLAMHAICIDINGPSYRQHVGKDRAAKLRSKGASREPAAAKAPS